MRSELDRLFGDYLAVQKPAQILPFGGLLVVKTFATNEIQVRIKNNIASLHRSDINAVRNGVAKRRSASLVLCAKSQTNPEDGEVYAKPRCRHFLSGAKHTLREAGAVMSQEYRLRVWFITLTLPGDSDDAILAMAQWDKEIKNAYLQCFRKLWKRVYGTPFKLDYVIVSEMQEERGAIHFHIAVAWPDERFAKLVKRLYRNWWYKLLRHYSAQTGTSFFADPTGYECVKQAGDMIISCEQVEKDVGSYLAKYLSKDASKCALEGVHTPSRWWSVSSTTRAKLLKERHAEQFSQITHSDSIAQADSLAALAASEGLECKPMVSRFTGEPLGFVIFCDQDKKGWWFECLKEWARNKILLPCDSLFKKWRACVCWNCTHKEGLCLKVGAFSAFSTVR